MILLGGTIFGSAPIAFADHSDDLKDKIAQITNLIKNFDADRKCPEKFKYEEICDLKKPEVDITFPQKGDEVPSRTITITGTASDDLSGIKEVLVRVDRGPYAKATFSGGVWEFTTELEQLPINSQREIHLVFVKAIDNVGNFKRDFTFFTVIS